MTGFLEVGQTLIAGGMAYRITDESPGTEDQGRRFELEQTETGVRKDVWEIDLRSAIANGLFQRKELPPSVAIAIPTPEEIEVIKRLPSDTYSQVAQQTMLLKLRMITALRRRGFTDFRNVDDLALEMRQVLADAKRSNDGDRFAGFRFKPSTIQVAAAKLKATGDPRCLLPRYDLRGGVNQTRTDPRAEDFLEISLQAAAEQTGPLRISDVFGATALQISQWNRLYPLRQATMVSRQTVARRFHKKFSAFYITSRNKGKAFANREFRESGVRIRAEEPLEAWQVDDTDGEVFLVCEKLRLPWGRPWLTLSIDEAYLNVPGYELSEQARSVWSAISCLVNGVLPKDMSRPEFADCKFGMVGEGVPAIVNMDNASYNFSPSLEAAIVDLHATPGWCKPRAPTNKPQIENLNHIVKTEFTPSLPGWRGPKDVRDGLKEGPHSSVFVLETYRRLFAKWLTDIYSNKPRVHGISPRQGWDCHFRLCKPLIPESPATLRLVATLREKHSFRASGGLLRLGLRYGSDALQNLRKRLGANATVETRIHPFDLSCIYVFDPTLEHFLVVPCLEPFEYVDGLTNYQQKLIRKRCAERKIRNPSFLDMVQARNELMLLVEQARRSTKLTERRFARRANINTNGAVPPASDPHVIATTSLEDSVRALDEVELDASEDPGFAIPTPEFE
jgi:putative transposase